MEQKHRSMSISDSVLNFMRCFSESRSRIPRSEGGSRFVCSGDVCVLRDPAASSSEEKKKKKRDSCSGLAVLSRSSKDTTKYVEVQ